MWGGGQALGGPWASRASQLRPLRSCLPEGKGLNEGPRVWTEGSAPGVTLCTGPGSHMGM